MRDGLHNASYRTHFEVTSCEGSSRDVDRFWSKVRKTDTCWLWAASRSGGSRGKRYGQFTFAGPGGQRITTSAHRFAYELQNGQIPDGLEILHTCNQGLCVRGSHMEVGTHAQNIADAVRDGLYVKRDIKGRKPKKLSDEQVQQVVALAGSGLPNKHIAERFGVSPTMVGLIVRGLRRQRVTERKREQVA